MQTPDMPPVSTWNEDDSQTFFDYARYFVPDREGWNMYRHPNPVDKPSRLMEQLLWLEQAGFRLACLGIQRVPAARSQSCLACPSCGMMYAWGKAITCGFPGQTTTGVLAAWYERLWPLRS